MNDKKNRKTIIGIVIIVLIAVVSGVALLYLGGQLGDAGGPGNIIKTSYALDLAITPVTIGLQQGFFNESGVSIADAGYVDPQDLGSALSSEKIDAVEVDPQTLIQLRTSGVPAIAVALVGTDARGGDANSSLYHWIVMNGTPLHCAGCYKRFNGTVKVGVPGYDSPQYTEHNAWLRKYHVPSNKTEYVIVPQAEQEQALTEHRIDIAILTPAYYGCPEGNKDFRRYATSNDAFNGSGGETYLVFREAFMKDHPVLVEKFIKAYKKCQLWCNNNCSEACELTAQAVGKCTGAVHSYSDSGRINETALQVWIDALVIDGKLKPGQVTPDDLYTDHFKDAW